MRRVATEAQLAALGPVATKIISLDLARTKVTDAGLKSVSAMTGVNTARVFPRMCLTSGVKMTGVIAKR